jgi:hypothetical protein
VFAKEDSYFCRSHKEYIHSIFESYEPNPDDNLIFEFIINHETKKISFSDKFYYENKNEITSEYEILSDQSFNVNIYFDEEKMFRAYADTLGEIVIFKNNVVITFSIPDVSEEDSENIGAISSATLFAKCYVM